MTCPHDWSKFFNGSGITGNVGHNTWARECLNCRLIELYNGKPRGIHVEVT